jgi:diacylglycerol O-acyltransferase / wax synthase
MGVRRFEPKPSPCAEMRQTIAFARSLNDADVGFYFLSKLSRCNVAMIFLGVLARPIEFTSAAAGLTQAVDAVPRYKDYLRPAPGDCGPPLWCPCPDFQMSDNIHEVAMPYGATWSDVLSVIDRIQSQPFPAHKPPWRFVVIKGLPSGSDLLLMKVHHALSDGTASTLMFAKAFAARALDSSGVEIDVECEPPPNRSSAYCAVRDCWSGLTAFASHGLRYGPKLVGRDARQHEVETWRRIVRPKRRWPRQSYSAARRLSCYRMQAATWREEAQKRNGGSNDLYLALAAAVMRRYWGTVDLDAEPLQIVMPMNIRDADAVQDGGNVTGVGVVALSGDAAHLTDLSAVRKQIEAVKEGARHQQQGIIDAGIGLLPGSIRARVQFREFAARDIVASTVPMPITGELGDIPFEMMFMIAPAIGAAVSFTLTSHGDSLYLATNADLGIIQAPQRFDECVTATLESVLGNGAVEALRGGTMTSAAVSGASLTG